MNQDIQIIEKANRDSLTYFNRLFADHSSTLQKLKSHLFEIRVRMDELSKTQNLYALNTDYRKNVFSPLQYQDEESQNEKKLKEEVDQLCSEIDDYEQQIDEEEIILKALSTRCESLKCAKEKIKKLAEYEQPERDETDNESSDISSDDDFEFVEEPDNDRDKYEKFQHLHRIGMLQIFDETMISDFLSKRVLDCVDINKHKLSMISKLIDSDPVQSRFLIDEMLNNEKTLNENINDELERLNFSLNNKENLDNIIFSYINDEIKKHPDIKFFTKFDINEDVQDYLITLYTIRLVKIFIDNIYMHSQANRIEILTRSETGMIEVDLTDNGLGIADNYEENLKWYGGISRANEMLYILDGSLEINNTGNGTKVVFKIPISR